MKEKNFINNVFNFTDATSPLTWNKILNISVFFCELNDFFKEIFALNLCNLGAYI